MIDWSFRVDPWGSRLESSDVPEPRSQKDVLGLSSTSALPDVHQLPVLETYFHDSLAPDLIALAFTMESIRAELLFLRVT